MSDQARLLARLVGAARPTNQEFRYEFVDFARHSVRGEGGADLAAGGGEVDTFFEGDLGGDGFGVVAGGGEGGVEGVGGVELGDRECPHQRGEISGAPLAARLERGDPSSQSLAREHCNQIAAFPKVPHRSPV